MTSHRSRNGRSSRRRSFASDVRFQQATRRVPAGNRPALLAWLRRYRRRADRVFWVLDAATGEWHRV